MFQLLHSTLSTLYEAFNIFSKSKLKKEYKSWNDIAYIYRFVCDRLPNSASSQDLSGKSSFFIKFFAMVTFFSHFFSSPAVPREAFFFH